MIIKYLKNENRYQVTKFLKYPEKITRFFDSFEDAKDVATSCYV